MTTLRRVKVSRYIFVKKPKNQNTHAKPKAKARKSAPVMAASISAAAAMLECSVSVLKAAKKAGAPGFRANNSVCISELKPWMAEHGKDFENVTDKNLLECRRISLQCEKLEFQNEVERKKYTHNDLLREQGIAIGTATRSELMQLKADAPTWSGLAAPDIETRVDAIIEKICANLHDSMNALYGR